MTRMNKTTKGALAAVAAALLLVGGAGTLAYWSETENVAAGEVTAGHMNLVPGAAGVWTEAGGTAPITASTFRMVPGDTLVFTRSFTIEALGDNLLADVTATGLPADGVLTTDLSFTINGVAGTQITDENDSQKIDVVVTVDFPSTVTGDAGEDVVVDLSGVAINLQQVPQPV